MLNNWVQAARTLNKQRLNMNLIYFVIISVFLLKPVCLEFSKFRRDDVIDGGKCVNITEFELDRTTTTLVKCLAECAKLSECVGIFDIVDILKCIGCSSLDLQTSTLASQYYRKLQPVGYVGCYADNPSRVLNEYHFSNGAMTNELCQNACFDRDFTYAATQFREHCFCGNSYNVLEIPDESQCYMTCIGDSSQICGASYRNSIYRVRIN